MPVSRDACIELVVRQDDVDDARGSVALEGLEVVGQVETRGLARLGRDVADEDPQRRGGKDRVPDRCQQQARQDTGEDAARPDHDHFGLCNRA